MLFGILLVNLLSAQNQDIVRDIDGNEYPTVIIGEQEWMAENLRTTKFNDGIPIPWVKDTVQWGSLITPGLSWYNNEPANKTTYGGLYNWYAVNTEKLCPNGWQVPSHTEWSVMTDYLGGINVPGTAIQMKGELKSTRTAPDDHPRWDRPNTGATDETGFAALPGGSRSYVGVFNYIGQFGFWWSSDESSPDYGWYRGMRHDNSDVFMTSGHKNNGLSVRCLREIK